MSATMCMPLRACRRLSSPDRIDWEVSHGERDGMEMSEIEGNMSTDRICEKNWSTCTRARVAEVAPVVIESYSLFLSVHHHPKIFDMNYHDTDDGSEEDTGQDQLTGNRKRSSRGTGSTLGPCASLKPTRSLRPVQEDEGELVVLPAPTL